MACYSPVQLAFNTVEPEGGASEKPPVIFAHGLTASKEYWNDILQKVANATKRKVYAIDARNHGDSVWTDVFNFDCNVDDLLHFMDTLGIPKAIIVGHSMGGYTGIRTALKMPERVEKLIVEDMGVGKVPTPILSMVEMYVMLAKNALLQVPDSVDEETARKIIVDFVVEHIPDEIKILAKPNTLENIPVQLKRTEDGRYTYKANVNIFEKALKNFSEIMTEHSGVYEGPAAFIYGKISPFLVGLDEPNIRKHFPNAEVVGIEDATHAVHTDCPREFTEAVLNFILRE